MHRINLLPWREELRQERQKNFGVAAAVAVALAAMVVWYTHSYFAARIDQQGRRNKFLEGQIAEIDEQIKEIRKLEETRERLIARMEIIDQLQRSRPVIVHLFDELVRTVPEGVYLTSIDQTNDRFLVKGIAQSSTRVSNYLRDIDASEWFQDAGLNILEKSGELIEFSIFFTEEKAKDDDGEEEASS